MAHYYLLSGLWVNILFGMEVLLVAIVIQAVNTVVFIRSRGALLGSNIALRQQLAVYQRRKHRPALKNRDRLFWIGLSRIWPQQR